MSKKIYSLKYYLYKNQTPEKQKELAIYLKEHCTLPTQHLFKKTSSASERVPFEELDYYSRLGSILRKLIENPSGVSRIASYYKRKKGSSVKPPRIKIMYKPLARAMVSALFKEGLVIKHEKGYCTSKKGKELIERIYVKQ